MPSYVIIREKHTLPEQLAVSLKGRMDEILFRYVWKQFMAEHGYGPPNPTTRPDDRH
jgi:hypothetical protein